MTDAQRILYVVTHGSYSDYGITAIFDSRELAEAACRGDESQIEEYVLNPGESEYRQGLSRWSIQIRRDGSVLRSDDLGFAWSDAPPEPRFRTEYAPGRVLQPVGVALEVDVWARDVTQAVKAANEVRARWIADGAWDRPAPTKDETPA